MTGVGSSWIWPTAPRRTVLEKPLVGCWPMWRIAGAIVPVAEVRGMTMKSIATAIRTGGVATSAPR